MCSSLSVFSHTADERRLTRSRRRAAISLIKPIKTYTLFAQSRNLLQQLCLSQIFRIFP